MKDVNCPSMLVYGKRVILWKCVLEGKTLFAEIGFFNRGITTPVLTFSDMQGNKILKVKTPDAFFKQKHRGRSQNIMMNVTEIIQTPSR